MNIDNLEIPYEGLEVCLRLSGYPKGKIIPHPFLRGIVILKEDNGEETRGMRVGTLSEFSNILLCLWEDCHKYVPTFTGWGVLSEDVCAVVAGYGDWKLHFTDGSVIKAKDKMFPANTFPEGVPFGTKFRRKYKCKNT